MRIRDLAVGVIALTLFSLPIAGCNSSGTNAGLTNGPPPVGSSEGAAVRSDLPGKLSSSNEPHGQVKVTGSNSGASR